MMPPSRTISAPTTTDNASEIKGKLTVRQSTGGSIGSVRNQRHDGADQLGQASIGAFEFAECVAPSKRKCYAYKQKKDPRGQSFQS